jgi:hypothetical protein
MPRIFRNTPWGRILWALQIVFSGFQELDPHERRQAREIAGRVYRDRRLDPKDRQRLMALARRVGRGAARGARGGGLRGARRRH